MDIVNNLRNKETIKKDLNDAFILISSMFKDRYLNKLHMDINLKREEIKKNPTKEIQLIQSIKPFCAKHHHDIIDTAVDKMYLVQTLKNISKDITTLNTNDIYEIDEACTQENRNILFGIAIIAVLVLQFRG